MKLETKIAFASVSKNPFPSTEFSGKSVQYNVNRNIHTMDTSSTSQQTNTAKQILSQWA